MPELNARNEEVLPDGVTLRLTVDQTKAEFESQKEEIEVLKADLIAKIDAKRDEEVAERTEGYDKIIAELDRKIDLFR